MSLRPESRFTHELVQEFNDGESIFEEGETGRELYIIQKGQVRITKKLNEQVLELATFKKGDFFGDMALLQSIPRYASALALGPTRLLILKPSGFLLKIRRDPTFAFELLQQISMRVRVSNDRLISMIKKFNLPQEEVQKIIQELGEQL